MPARVTHKFNNPLIFHLTQSPAGGVAKDLIKRGARVQSKARRNLGGTTGTGPRRINTGLLRASIATQLITRPNFMTMRVGTGVHYALYVHDGTGLYGPKKILIKPKHGKVLVFRSALYGAKKGKFLGKVVVRSVKGMKPNPFLKKALPSASFKNPA